MRVYQTKVKGDEHKIHSYYETRIASPAIHNKLSQVYQVTPLLFIRRKDQDRPIEKVYGCRRLGFPDPIVHLYTYKSQ